ncbi:unnamed protein product [Rhodiola kirilowii]
MGVSDDKNPSLLSTPTKSYTKLTSSVEAKENRLASPNIQTAYMKSSAKKNFMSPTISAASKAVCQRKKVLTERNSAEVTEPTCAKLHHRRSSSLDLKQGSADKSVSIYSSTDSLTSRIKEIASAEDGEDGAELKPYDPVFNYCSPRPKFLLYKPNRRSEILRRYEMVDGTSSESETGCENDECLVKQTEQLTENIGDGEYADHKAEETAAQLEEEAGTSVLDNIEGHVEEEVHENVGEDVKKPHEKSEEHKLDDKFIKRQSLSCQLVAGTRKLEQETGDIKNEASGSEEGDDKTIQSMEVEEEGDFEDVVENGWSLKMYVKLWFVIFVVGLSTLYVSSMNSTSGVVEDEYWKIHNGLNGAPFIYENASGYGVQGEMAKMGFEVASCSTKDVTLIGDPDNKIDVTDDGLGEVNYDGNQVEDLGDFLDDKLSELFTADQLTQIINYMAEGILGDIVHDETVHVEESAPEGSRLPLDGIANENHDVVNEVVEPQSGASEASSYVEMDVLVDHTRMAPEETVVVQDATGDRVEVEDRELQSMECFMENANDETLNLEDEPAVSEVSIPDLVDELTMIYTEGTDRNMIFGLISALLLAFLGVLGFCKSKRTAMPLIREAGIAEQDDIRGHGQVKQVGPFEHSSYSRPGAKVPVSQTFKSGLGATNVELLEEFTVREQEVSSLRTGYTENYDDNTCSFSQRNMHMSAKPTSKTHVDSQPDVSQFSSTTESPPYGSFNSQRRSSNKELPTSSIDSPSYGSFTTEMMFRKKEEAREKIIVTPVRRSSRIRGRMTPGASQ